MSNRPLPSSGALPILIWMAAFGGAGFLLATVLPKKYEATSTLLFPKASQSDSNTGRAILSPFQQDREGTDLLQGQIFLPTVGTSPTSLVDIVESRACAEELAKKHSEALFGGSATERQIEELQERIAVEVTTNGNLIVRFSDSDRERATQVIETILSFAESRVRAMSSEFAKESLAFLQDEVVKRHLDVSAKSRQLNEALQSSDISLVAGARDRMLAQLVDASSSLWQIETDLGGLDASLGYTINAAKRALRDGVDGEAYTKLALELQYAVAKVKQRLNDAEKSLASNSPEMQRLRNEYRAASKSYVDELDRTVRAAMDRTLSINIEEESARAGLLAKLGKARRRVGELRDQNLSLVSAELSQRQLSKDLGRAEAQLDLAANQLMMARLAEEKRYKPFVVLDKAYASARPSFPKRGMFTAAGIGIGLFVGLFLYVRALGRRLESTEIA